MSDLPITDHAYITFERPNPSRHEENALVVPAREDLPVDPAAGASALSRSTCEALWEGVASLAGIWSPRRRLSIPALHDKSGQAIQPAFSDHDALVALAAEAFAHHGGFRMRAADLPERATVNRCHQRYLQVIPGRRDVPVDERSILSPELTEAFYQVSNLSGITAGGVVAVHDAEGREIQPMIPRAQMQPLLERSMAHYGGLHGLRAALYPYDGVAKISFDPREGPVDPAGLMSVQQVWAAGPVMRLRKGEAMIPERRDASGRMLQPMIPPEQFKALYERSVAHYGGPEGVRKLWSEAISKGTAYTRSVADFEALEEWRERQTYRQALEKRQRKDQHSITVKKRGAQVNR